MQPRQRSLEVTGGDPISLASYDRITVTDAGAGEVSPLLTVANAFAIRSGNGMGGKPTIRLAAGDHDLHLDLQADAPLTIRIESGRNVTITSTRADHTIELGTISSVTARDEGLACRLLDGATVGLGGSWRQVTGGKGASLTMSGRPPANPKIRMPDGNVTVDDPTGDWDIAAQTINLRRGQTQRPRDALHPLAAGRYAATECIRIVRCKADAIDVIGGTIEVQLSEVVDSHLTADRIEMPTSPCTGSTIELSDGKSEFGAVVDTTITVGGDGPVEVAATSLTGGAVTGPAALVITGDVENCRLTGVHSVDAAGRMQLMDGAHSVDAITAQHIEVAGHLACHGTIRFGEQLILRGSIGRDATGAHPDIIGGPLGGHDDGTTADIGDCGAVIVEPDGRITAARLQAGTITVPRDASPSVRASMVTTGRIRGSISADSVDTPVWEHGGSAWINGRCRIGGTTVEGSFLIAIGETDDDGEPVDGPTVLHVQSAAQGPQQVEFTDIDDGHDIHVEYLGAHVTVVMPAEDFAKGIEVILVQSGIEVLNGRHRFSDPLEVQWEDEDPVATLSIVRDPSGSEGPAITMALAKDMTGTPPPLVLTAHRGERHFGHVKVHGTFRAPEFDKGVRPEIAPSVLLSQATRVIHYTRSTGASDPDTTWTRLIVDAGARIDRTDSRIDVGLPLLGTIVGGDIHAFHDVDLPGAPDPPTGRLVDVALHRIAHQDLRRLADILVVSPTSESLLTKVTGGTPRRRMWGRPIAWNWAEDDNYVEARVRAEWLAELREQVGARIPPGSGRADLDYAVSRADHAALPPRSVERFGRMLNRSVGYSSRWWTAAVTTIALVVLTSTIARGPLGNLTPWRLNVLASNLQRCDGVPIEQACTPAPTDFWGLLVAHLLLPLATILRLGDAPPLYTQPAVQLTAAVIIGLPLTFTLIGIRKNLRERESKTP